jgi:hypothetical protein
VFLEHKDGFWQAQQNSNDLSIRPFGTLEHLVAASEIDKYPNRSAWDIREILVR